MKITIQTSELTMVENFFEFLKKRASEQEHVQNRCAIAEFIDKFLVVEMKRSANTPNFVDQEVEIPNEILLDPLRRAEEQLDNTFDAFLKGQGAPASATGDPSDSPAEPSESLSPSSTVKRKRSGNGHRSLKKRDLTDNEKDDIKNWFIGMNGCVADDRCRDKQRTMDLDISPFQVTGTVTQLHYKVAENQITLDDLDSYLMFMKQHKSAIYNSSRYQKALAQGTTVKPKFASGFVNP